MNEQLKSNIKEYMAPFVTEIGFAPVDRFTQSPDKHHPSRICKDAETVIVFGIVVPRGMLHSPDYRLYFLHRTYHSVYMHLDELALKLCNFIESQENYLAVPIPTFAPLVYEEFMPWGVLSLKHAAVNAGLGAFGKSGLMYHPKHGSLLRLGAVVTSASLPVDPMIEKDPCPKKCKACQEVCPSGAFDSDGNFKKDVCLAYSTKHAIYPIALRDEKGLKHIERIINTAGYNYWLTCNECLRVCPLNRISSKKH
jgi:epoxyqueuosine reductase